MRVIAGQARGRRLAVPPGTTVRPTADRVREALFSSLAARVPGARVLDAYAGSGALGVEALSRGAAWATFVERDARATRTVETNLERTGLTARATVVRATVARFCAEPRGGPFDLVLADPPYALAVGTVFERLAALHAAGGLAPGALVVVERDRRRLDPGAAAPPFLAPGGSRTYGDTVLLSYACRPGGGQTDEERGAP